MHTSKLEEMKKRFDGYKDYKNLPPRYATHVSTILTQLRYPKHVRKLMAECTRTRMSNRFFYAAMEWVRKNGFVETQRERKRKLVCSLTEKGKGALEYLSAPRYDFIEFRVDGERRGKIKLMVKNDKGEAVALEAFKLGLLIDMVAEGHPRVLEGIFYLGNRGRLAGENIHLDVQSELSKANLDISNLEDIMWDFYLSTVEKKLPEMVTLDFMGKFEPFYPDNKEALTAVTREYLGREKARFHEKVRRHFPYKSSLQLPASSRTLDPELIMAENAYKHFWVERVQEAKEELQERGEITIEKYVPQTVIVEQKRPACAEWIKRRLAEDANFFMPGFFWSRLGFKVARGGRADASRPYNTLLDKPKFARMIGDLLWPFEFMAHVCRVKFIRDQQGKISVEKLLLSPTVLIKYHPQILKEEEFDFRGMVKDAFEGFISMLGRYQNTDEFYDAWRVMGQRKYVVTGNERELVRNGAKMVKDEVFPRFYGKDLMIFAPIQEALIQYIMAGKKPVVDLAHVYSDLLEEKITPAEATEAIERGEYALKG